MSNGLIAVGNVIKTEEKLGTAREKQAAVCSAPRKKSCILFQKEQSGIAGDVKYQRPISSHQCL